MKIIAIQHDIAWEDKTANLAAAERTLDAACDRGADWVCLPEMFATGFSMNAGAIREPAEGPTWQWLAKQAAARSIFLLGAFVERAHEPTPQPRGRNVAVLFDRGGNEILRYTKRHPFTPQDEHVHYESGTDVRVVEAAGFRVAIQICYDLRFPEDFRRATLEQGADLFLVPASWPAARGHHWDLLLRARALENLAYVVAVNRVGEGDGLAFDGRSQVVSPLGDVLAHGGHEAGLVEADIDPEEVAKIRRETPYLRDAARQGEPLRRN